MNTRVIVGVALTGAVVLASCTQDQPSAPSLPTEANFARATTCSFSTANQNARAYFLDTKDAVFGLLDAMQEAYRTGGAEGATDEGFAVLARLGVAANNGATLVKGSPTVGNTFANNILGCMAGVSSGNFIQALGPTGLFGVRYGGTSTAIIARNLDANTLLPLGGTPLYGAEPMAAGGITLGTWSFTGPVLFHGSQLGQPSIAGQVKAGVLFTLKTTPVTTFDPPMRAGVCDVDDAFVNSARTAHQHDNQAFAQILPPAGVPAFCTSPPPLTASRTTSFKQMLANMFTPQPLYAFGFGGGGAGLVDGLSDIGPVIFEDSLAFQGTIPKAFVKDTIKAFDGNSNTSQFKDIVTVRAVSKSAKNPLVGVTITLMVIGNNGSYDAPNGSAKTDSDGYARFPDFYVNKAGGYTISATAHEFDPGAYVAVSNQFIVSGQ